ncbi:MAG: GTPase HflX [Synechococcus sp. ELA057]
MKQSALAGRTAGLRPAERRRLERLCHRRHPAEAIADPAILQRLAQEARDLELPLSLVVDERGLCRLLWVGDLEGSSRLMEHLGGSQRRQGHALRLLTCKGLGRQPQLQPAPQEALVAMDLQACLWLRFAQDSGRGGEWPALLLRPDAGPSPWRTAGEGHLNALCEEPPQEAGEAEERDGKRTAATQERVLLLCLSGSNPIRSQREVAELEGLVRSAGGIPVGVVEQRRRHDSSGPLWGEGKLQEAALEARRLGADLVVTDRELTPVQSRNLERSLDLPVSDRSELILDIFAQRAASGAGRLQVELAQLRYRLPRLVGRGSSLSRQGGGIGTRGPGETQLEKDRRAIARRLERLQREVARLGEHRARLRQRRGGLCRLALVGYTNAGKSSLLNALTRAPAQEAVLAEDKLFATLDPTTRRLQLIDEQGRVERSLLITDTVGFIRDLPPPLVEAFRSTIEEALDADGLLLVVDLADPDWPEQLTTVRRILDGLGSELPQLVVGNQIDRCPAAELERARALEPAMLFISATAALGLQNLQRRLLVWPADTRGDGDTEPGGAQGPVPTSES